MVSIRKALYTCSAFAVAALLSVGAASAQSCEPEKVAEKYPGLAGRTIKIGADPQTPPYVMRDAQNFENLVGIDADVARAVFDCAGVKHEFVAGAWSGLLPAVMMDVGFAGVIAGCAGWTTGSSLASTRTWKGARRPMPAPTW